MSVEVIRGKSGLQSKTCKVEFHVDRKYSGCTVNVSNKDDDIVELDFNFTEVGLKTKH